MTDLGGVTSMKELLSEDSRARLQRLAEVGAAAYQAAEPFPHAVLDDFLPAAALERALADFPTPEKFQWLEFKGEHEDKLAFFEAERLPESIRNVLYFINSAVMLRFLERLTGIEGLLPDPYYFGGGVHQIERGGRLEVHADFNRSEKLNLDRRLNLLLYLNRDWREEYGGHLELWDRAMTHCVRNILPVFNRCVVFSTTATSFHGHPIPLACPQGWTRKSIATYYYTVPASTGADRAHYTLFQSRPEAGAPARLAAPSKAKEVIKSFLPPIALQAYRRLRGRRG